MKATWFFLQRTDWPLCIGHTFVNLSSNDVLLLELGLPSGIRLEKLQASYPVEQYMCSTSVVYLNPNLTL